MKTQGTQTSKPITIKDEKPPCFKAAD